jgi:uncharacterized protein YkwD
MSWTAAFVVALALTAEPAARDVAPVSGRCRDGRVWTTTPVEQGQMLDLLNRARADAKRAPLTRVAVLDRMALAHAADMACRNYFDHRNPERMRLQDRLTRANDGSLTAWSRVAEVIGTSATPARQLARWLDSRAHRRAVLEDEHDRVGIGFVRIAGSRYATYWAVEFVGQGR